MTRTMDQEQYDANFPSDARNLIGKLLDNKDWTWDGLAEYLARNVNSGDLDDFYYLLQDRIIFLMEEDLHGTAE